MWNTLTYAAAGRSHIAGGIPCQDKVLSCRRNGVTVTVLADGAGSACFSHFGAEAAVEYMCEVLSERFWEVYAADAVEVRRTLCTGLWQKLEEVRSEIGCRICDLASTLLVSAVCAGYFILIHIGDGVIGYVRDGALNTASGPDRGRFANETYFTTSIGAAGRMHLVKGRLNGISAFVLMSDGTQATLYNSVTAEFSRGLLRVMQTMCLYSESLVERMLGDCFRELVLTGTTDDCSIALLVDTSGFRGFKELKCREQMELTGLSSGSRHVSGRLKQFGRLLDNDKGWSVREAARSLHVKPAYAARKLRYLVDMELMLCKNGRYYPSGKEEKE